ncbi:MAG: sigma-70 family RNA polymerase sigma factor [Candidatus Omnitrophota bacterium]
MFKLFHNKEFVQSFEDNLLAHMDPLYNLALRLTRNREQAEDLVQDASLRGFKAYHQFTEGTNFKAWIFTILRNTFINDYRKKNREPVQVNFEEVEGFVSLPEITGFEEELFGEAVQQSMDQLPEELRTTIMLFYVEELAYKEIADVMKCPIGTVMSRLFTARQYMKKKMTQLAKNSPASVYRPEQKPKEEC